MFRNRLYYLLKPFIPRRLRLGLRRAANRAIRKRCGEIWPILERAAKRPADWPGWPDGKRFAFVMTHDVESQTGVDRVKELAELEMSLGFRSSYNFVPEGSYQTPPELIDWLLAKGFEVGVHDLHHDGHLYRSRRSFRDKAQRINGHLDKWNAVGFRSGFMLHQLDWLHDLNIQYDSSTFDTDPFEPQTDGAETIFPYWEDDGLGGGYVELPYTLPQDSTLFVYGDETTPDIWTKKLQWIASHGGMAMCIVHPDYIAMSEKAGIHEYPVSIYKEFLEFVRTQYHGLYWSPLPKELAEYVKCNLQLSRSADKQDRAAPDSHRSSGRAGKIWIDLENTPHIPFFKPIIRELEARGYSVVLTARDAFQTCEMATQYGLEHTRIGRHYGQNRTRKVCGLLIRSLQLLPFALRERPTLALNHGARAQILICNLLRIPNVLIMDYEHSQTLPMVRPWWEIVPDVVADEGLHCRRKERIRKYAGIKEDVYVPEFTPDPSIVQELQLNGDMTITVRPPATEAHYHNPEAEVLFEHFMNRVSRTEGTKVVLLPRNRRQEADIRKNHPDWFQNSKVIIPDHVVDGLNLLWHSDLVVSGGGTMNREAAALGVPVYSIFRGTIGAVDRALQSEGRLTLIESTKDIDDKIAFKRRNRTLKADESSRQALSDIVEHVHAIAKLYRRV